MTDTSRVRAKFNYDAIEIEAPTIQGFTVAARSAVRWLSGTRKWAALRTRAEMAELEVVRLQIALADANRHRKRTQRLLMDVRVRMLRNKTERRET